MEGGKDIYFLGLVDVIERIIKLFPHFYQWWYPLTSHLEAWLLHALSTVAGKDN